MELDVENLPQGFKLGHYVVKSLIAVGGMGVVYKAYEPQLNRIVAIKVLGRFYAQDPAAVSSFQEEARAVAAISHPNIVPIHFIGTENGCTFFSMGLIEGGTLDDWIDRDQYFTEQDAFWFLEQAVAALDAAFRAKIVHLDIKPSNFLINHQKQLFLTDFGLAENLAGDPNLAQNKSGMGTPFYVSPEQIYQDPTDQRTDIYSLGATLFHLMVKQPPFNGNSLQDLVKGHLYGEFPEATARAAGLSDGWVELLRKMLKKDPTERYADYQELSTAIQSLRATPKAIELAPPKRTDVVESDVFISHSDRDKEMADQVCLFLEQNSLRCWLAPRDIGTGATWATSFVLAVTRTKVMVVLLSNHSNDSQQVHRELEEAAHFGKPIIIVRLEDVQLSEDLARLKETRTLDAFLEPVPFERVVQLVQEEIKELESQKQLPDPKATRPYSKFMVKIGMLLVMAAYCLGVYLIPPRPNSSAPAPLGISPGDLELIATSIKEIDAEEKKLAPLPKHKIVHGVNLAIDQYYESSLDQLMKAVDLFAAAGVKRIDLTPPAAYWGPHFIEIDQPLCAYIRKKGIEINLGAAGILTKQSQTMQEYQDKCCNVDAQIASALHPNSFFVLSSVQKTLKMISIHPEPTPDDWERFVIAICAAVKKADPDIRLGIAGNAVDQELMKRLMKLPCVDIVGIDVFSISDLEQDRTLADLATQEHKSVYLRRTWHPHSDKQSWGDYAHIENEEMDAKWITMINHFTQTSAFESVSYYDGPAFFFYQKDPITNSSVYMSAAADAAGKGQTTPAYVALKAACAEQ